MGKIRQMPNGKIMCNARARLLRISWDDLCDEDLKLGNGFRITEPGKTDKDEEPGLYSIHSPLFGTDWGDANAFEDRWSCECGEYVGMYYADKGFVCPKCKKPVKFVGVDLKKRGWIILDRNWLINPFMFYKLESFIGKSVFDDIINYHSVYDNTDRGEPLSPFGRIGMISFVERFDEIMDYFLKKNKKEELYIFIMSNKSTIFTKSIPVYSLMVRHFMIKDGKVKYTDDDKIFKRLYTNHELLNNDFILARKKEKAKNITGIERLRKEHILYRMQQDLQKLWNFAFDAIDDKGGIISGQVIAGRMDFTARNVIVCDTSLRMDEVDIGYITALEEFKLEFLDLTTKMYGISYREASNIWQEARRVYSEKVYNILTFMVESTPRYISIYRNPSINYGSRMLTKIRKINKGIDDVCLALSPQVLIKPNADFDGDIMALIFHKIGDISEDLFRRLNPRSNFMVDRNTGLFDMDSNLFKDQAAILYAFLNI